MQPRKRIGIFGWGVVAPKSPNVDAFERNLETASSWLEPFRGFGPDNFLVGNPAFEFRDYRAWIDQRFEPRKFAQLDEKMGNNVKYTIGAFIQAMSQNEGMESALRELGTQAHVYIGTGLGDFPLQFRVSLAYHRAQVRWNRFWCRPDHHPELAAYRAAPPEERDALRFQSGAPEDPAERVPEDDGYDEVCEAWWGFWVHRSKGLLQYLGELREVEAVGIAGDIDREKGHVIKRKTVARRQLQKKYGCPEEPWNSVDASLLWNIPNIPAAQVSMLGHITGPALAPVAACSGFGTCLKLALNAIELGQAKAVVVGTTDPEPHPLSVGTFFNARVLSHDGQASRPFGGLQGTHVAGGACVWIVGDADYFLARGMRPLGLEILSVALTSDADHIITPSREGPLTAIRQALESAGVTEDEVTTWDMHATATPGDWNELQNTLAAFPSGRTLLTARKGSFGHGMSVCGGWELTAQHLGLAGGRVLPVSISEETVHAQVRPHFGRMVQEQAVQVEGEVAGKINMGVGGINACVICRRWPDAPPA